MAQIFAASIYGVNVNPTGGAMGTTMGFPSQHCLIRPAPANTVFGTTTVLSIIQLIPSGTVVNQPQYYSIASVSTLISAANA